MKVCKIIYLLLVLSTLSAFGQRVVISGTVSGQDEQPLEYIQVYIEGTVNSTYTDTKGKYSLGIVPSDSLTVVFSSLGYVKTKIPMSGIEENVTLNVKMRATDYNLEGVEVRSNRIQVGSMDRITTDNTRFSVDATGGSVESIVIMSGRGVSSSNELSSQYSVRGGSYNENIVYVNGIEVYRPVLIRSGQQEGLSFINPDLTGDVDFSSGGFDARYGDKMSSVLNVTYRKPKQFEGGVMASMLGGNVYIGSTTGKFSQISGFRYKRGTTLLKTLDTKGDYNPAAMDFQTYMTYQFSSKLSLSFLGNYSDNTYDFNPQTRETSWGTQEHQKKFTVYYEGMERDRFRTLFGAGTLKYALNEYADFSLQVSGFQSKEEVTYDIRGDYWLSDVMGDEESNVGVGMFHQHARNYLTLDVFNATLSGKVAFNDNTIRWGVTVQNERIKDRVNEWELLDSMGYSIPHKEDLLTMSYNLHSRNKMQTMRYSAYVQDTYLLPIEDGLLSFTGGIRGSYWDFNKEFVFSPRVSVGFVPSKNRNLTLRFATGLYYQTPFYKEFRVVEKDENGNEFVRLNDKIKSQRSIHFVLGGDYNFRVDDRPFKFTAELYYKKLDNLIPYTVENVKIWYAGENISKGYAVGIDTKIFGQFVPGTDSWIGFSLMQAKQKINGETVSMPTDQLYNVTLYYTDYFPKMVRLQGNLKLVWAQGLPFGIPGQFKPIFRTPPYRRVDFGLSYHLWKEDDIDKRRSRVWNNFRNIQVGVDIFNLLDIKNISSYSWFTDVNQMMNPIPDRLTGRQINIKLLAEF